MQHRKMFQPAELMESQPAGPQRPAKIPVCKLALDSMGAPTGPAGGVPLPLFTRKYSQYSAGSPTGEVRGWYPPYLVCKPVRLNRPT